MLGKILRLFQNEPARRREERPLVRARSPRLGLALSSGGAWGLAYVGVLEENGIDPNDIRFHTWDEMRKLQGVGKELKARKVKDNRPKP